MILEVLGSTVGRRSSRRPSSHGVGTFLRFTRRVPGFGTALPLASWPPVLATLGALPLPIGIRWLERVNG